MPHTLSEGGSTGRVDDRDRRDQRRTSCEETSARAYARRPLINCTIPMPYALHLGLQEETRQEVVRLLMCRRVCLKAGATTGRKWAVIIRNIHITVTFHSPDCDRGRRTIG